MCERICDRCVKEDVEGGCKMGVRVGGGGV